MKMLQINWIRFTTLLAKAYDHEKHCYKRRMLAIEKGTIAMLKTSKMFFRYNGEDMPLTTIYSKNKKRRGRSRYLRSVIVEVVKDEKIETSSCIISDL